MPDLPIFNGADNHLRWHMLSVTPTVYATNTPVGVLVRSSAGPGAPLTTVPDVQVAQRWTAHVVEADADEGSDEHIVLVREIGLRLEVVDGPTQLHGYTYVDSEGTLQGVAETRPTPLGAWYSADVDMPRPSDDEIHELAGLHRDVLDVDNTPVHPDDAGPTTAEASPAPDDNPSAPGDLPLTMSAHELQSLRDACASSSESGAGLAATLLREIDALSVTLARKSASPKPDAGLQTRVQDILTLQGWQRATLATTTPTNYLVDVMREHGPEAYGAACVLADLGPNDASRSDREGALKVLIASMRGTSAEDAASRKRSQQPPAVVREILSWSPSSDCLTLTLLVGTDGQRELHEWVDRQALSREWPTIEDVLAYDDERPNPTPADIRFALQAIWDKPHRAPLYLADLLASKSGPSSRPEPETPRRPATNRTQAYTRKDG